MTAQPEPSRDPAIKGFAIALGAFRVKAGMGKKELAEKLGYTPAYVSQVEAAKNVPSMKFAEDLNTLFDTEAFTELRQNITDSKGNSIFPPGFTDLLEREAVASTIYIFSAMVVHGLFQTPEYAYEILKSGRASDEIEQLVAKRLSRQSLLVRESPPQIVAVFDEGCIRRAIGGTAVMKSQVEHLIELAARPNIMLQVVPSSAGSYLGVMGAFIMMEFDEAPGVVYTEDYVGVNLANHPAVVREYKISLNLIRASALSVDDSMKLLRAVREDL
ncbi:helix-turn-helix domain-containing protein [Actinocorallia populi]|uniref:helix-turn-helix domain-containing protein n=1 Tax=Actinocorallia populi TaxID=2079200 RepID=UPI0013003D65|nr:helix-turn-helix transcriptional regulator [Actinocorallia populi]